MCKNKPPALTIPHWEEYQHFKDRRPLWIKLHDKLLDDYEFSNLDDLSKLHLILIWILAARTVEMKGKTLTPPAIPEDAVWIQKKIGVSSPVNLDTLIRAGFLERVSKPYQVGTEVYQSDIKQDEISSKLANSNVCSSVSKPYQVGTEVYQSDIKVVHDTPTTCTPETETETELSADADLEVEAEEEIVASANISQQEKQLADDWAEWEKEQASTPEPKKSSGHPVLPYSYEEYKAAKIAAAINGEEKDFVENHWGTPHIHTQQEELEVDPDAWMYEEDRVVEEAVPSEPSSSLASASQKWKQKREALLGKNEPVEESEETRPPLEAEYPEIANRLLTAHRVFAQHFYDAEEKYYTSKTFEALAGNPTYKERADILEEIAGHLIQSGYEPEHFMAYVFNEWKNFNNPALAKQFKTAGGIGFPSLTSIYKNYTYLLEQFLAVPRGGYVCTLPTTQEEVVVLDGR